MAWNVELTNEAAKWYAGLNRQDQLKIGAAIDSLEERGPTLGRPHVDTIKGSRHHNMKELRSVGGHLRALFCFDPVRNAIVLIGGDKTNDWTGWYERAIRRADDLYDDYLAELRSEGVLPDG